MERLVVGLATVVALACGSAESSSPEMPSGAAENAATLEEIAEEAPEQEPEPEPEQATPTHRPTRAWVGDGCRLGETRALSDDAGPLRVHRNGGLALDASGDAGLLAYGSGTHELRIVPIDGSGSRRGDSTAIELRRVRGTMGVRRSGEGYLFYAEAKCPDSNHTCMYGYTLGADGSPVGDASSDRLRLGDLGGVSLLPVHAAAPGTLFLCGEASTGGRASWFAWRALRAGPEGLSLESGRAGALQAGAETNYVRSRLQDADDEHLHMLYGYEYDHPDDGRPIRRRALALAGRKVDVTGFGGAIRDFVVVDGVANVLVEEPRGTFFAVAITESGAAAEERTSIPSEGPIPAPFDQRVRLSTADDGSIRLRDAMGRAIGDAIELGHARIAFTGDRFLVAHAGARGQISITAVECGTGGP